MKIASRKFVGLLLGLGMALAARAGSIVNNFNTSDDFLNNGVLGTMWDGVYLGYGGVPGGNNGGDGNGATLAANDTTIPGYLYLQTTATSWAGAGNDGFFLWRVVSGDFDVSVHNAAPYDNSAYHFSGLLVRAYSTNGPAWGRPFSITSTNEVENWLNITRFNEFSIGDQIRYATNGTDIQISAPFNSGSTNYNTETNNDRYFRITRVGNMFSFYDKTNQSDAWVLETNISRPDLDGIPMQVGIEDATFSGAQPGTYYTDFQLSGPNVVPSYTTPADPSGLTSTVSGNDVVVSWTKAAGSDGSVVLLRENNPQVNTLKPINGYTYAGNTNFGSGDTLGSGLYVVYAGTGNSVTISGLSSDLNNYTAVVYSYSGSGSTTVYDTNPPTITFPGPGKVTSVDLSVANTNLPAGGANLATVIGNFSTGDSNDFSFSTNVVWSSSDTNVAIGGPGAITGVGVGTATVTATLSGHSDSVEVKVHAPTYANNFSNNHDFVADGLPGSTWDGLYLGHGDFPGQTSGRSGTVTNDANITATNTLTIASYGTAWEAADDNGYFLFKNVPGDFQMAVHITSATTPAYHFYGLQARAANTNGASLASGEYHINLWRFDEFGISSSVRVTANDGLPVVMDQTDGDTTNYWLLMTRTDGTNFNFFKRASASQPWQSIPGTTQVRADLAGTALQVGLADAMYTGNTGLVQYAKFMLDASGLATPAAEPAGPTDVQVAANADGTVDVSWNPGTGVDGSVVVMRAGAPVNMQPVAGVAYIGNSTFGLGEDLGSSNYVVYSGTGTNVTVNGLTPGLHYWVTVYSYAGSGSTLGYSYSGAQTGTVIAQGVVSYVDVLPAGDSIVNGGILPFSAIAVYTNGIMQNVSGMVTISSDPAGAIAGAQGVLTAVTNGSATVYATFNGVTSTNDPVLTVRNPSFSDDFTVNHDYLANGVTGTSWEGVYAYPNSTIPDSTYASDAAAQVFTADANVTSNGVLTVSSENVGWEFGQNDGFFLYKYVPGDFQMAVHVDFDTNNIIGYDNPGLLARAYGVATNGMIGAPFGGTNGESWVSWTRFDQFGIGTYARSTADNGTTRSTQPDQFDGQYWLLMVRRQGTNFLFYQRLNETDPWTPAPTGITYSLPNFAGMPMQVGILAGGFISGNQVTDQFDHFMLDVAPYAPALTATQVGNNVLVSWPAVPNGSYTLESTSSLSSPNWQPVTQSPVFAEGLDVVTIPASNGAAYYRLSAP